ncbi:putative myb-related protein-like [Capsicum annuum]|uniref:U6 snRNA phosphodiesterase 1-like isoform X2 n=1 Tax=Capsicum annuum TaxID=4072 RepID=UPI001FB0E94F|nr:U6 snRNA phosphodiesterase 1-like isoform X2 [Capsicum annuum]KAF3663634.1 putative myb-related protein-like [Capsicum annuum]
MRSILEVWTRLSDESVTVLDRGRAKQYGVSEEVRYLIDFNKWEIFVNDDSTRSFMSLEVVAGGLAQDPRPHVSLAWTLGDIRDTLKRMVEEEMKKYKAGLSSQQKCIFTSKFNGILCKIGNKMHEICKFQEE